MALKIDYKDDVLDVSKNERRKYRMISNTDGTVSFEDVTEYAQVGDSYGSVDINETNNAVNGLVGSILDSMSAINANTQANQLAGANAVKELAAEKTAYYPGKDFNTEDELLEYATSILTTSLTAFVPISLVNGNANIPVSYSSGYIVNRYDTCSVVLFGYSNSRIRVNSRSKAGSWTGWKEQAFSDDLAQYLPKTGGTLIGNLNAVLKDGIAYFVSNGTRTYGLHVNASGEGGIYDSTNARWLIGERSDGSVQLKGVDVSKMLIVDSWDTSTGTLNLKTLI